MALTNSNPLDIAVAASKSARALASLSKEERNAGLTAVHYALATSKAEILQANARDVDAASKAGEKGELSQSLLKRLDLRKPGKYEDMLKGILDVRELEDPGA